MSFIGNYSPHYAEQLAVIDRPKFSCFSWCLKFIMANLKKTIDKYDPKKHKEEKELKIRLFMSEVGMCEQCSEICLMKFRK